MALVQFPSNLIISNVSVEHNVPNFSTESLNLKQKKRSRGLHRLEGSLDITIGGTLADQKAWTAFILSAQGSLNEYELNLPLHFKSSIVNPVIISPVGVGANELTLSAFDGTIDAGSCFTMLNDTKIYYALNSATSGGTIKIFPPLRQAQLASTQVNFSTPVITARFKDDMQTTTYTEQGLILDANIGWVEAL